MQQVGKIIQLVNNEIKPLRRKDIEASEDAWERQLLSMLTQLAYRYPQKAIELADRIRREALSQEFSESL